MSKSKLLFLATAGLVAAMLSFVSPTAGACAQVTTWAINPATGECREFATPCAVPAGWKKYNHDVCGG